MRCFSRGASGIEYVIALVLVAMTIIIGYRAFGKQVRCRMGLATSAMALDGSKGESCDDDDAVAQNGPSNSGASSGPAGPSVSVECEPCKVKGPNGEPGCFVAGTSVMTEDGPRAIETIAVGTTVLTRDQFGGDLEWRPVVRTFVHDVHAPLVRLTVATAQGVADTLVATANHPLQSDERGWIAAGELVPGRDHLLDANGERLAVLDGETLASNERVYNFEVEAAHTYYVGRLQVWAHNDCTKLQPPPGDTGPKLTAYPPTTPPPPVNQPVTLPATPPPAAAPPPAPQGPTVLFQPPAPPPATYPPPAPPAPPTPPTPSSSGHGSVVNVANGLALAGGATGIPNGLADGRAITQSFAFSNTGSLTQAIGAGLGGAGQINEWRENGPPDSTAGKVALGLGATGNVINVGSGIYGTVANYHNDPGQQQSGAGGSAAGNAFNAGSHVADAVRIWQSKGYKSWQDRRTAEFLLHLWGFTNETLGFTQNLMNHLGVDPTTQVMVQEVAGYSGAAAAVVGIVYLGLDKWYPVDNAPLLPPPGGTGSPPLVPPPVIVTPPPTIILTPPDPDPTVTPPPTIVVTPPGSLAPPSHHSGTFGPKSHTR